VNTRDVRLVDLGCGLRKKDGYFGLDVHGYEGVDLVQDLKMSQLPFEDEQLEALYASHFLEHLDFEEVIHLMNEAYRVLQVGGIFEIVVPHGMSYAGMADLSHKTFWTEDSFGYFTPENVAYYDWNVINRWRVKSNDSTPPYEYTVKGWVELKAREIHAFLEKLPLRDEVKNEA
jgi:SAM-dependent methyltransferase